MAVAERHYKGTERTSSGLTEVKEARLLRRALRWKQNQEQRFPTRMTARQLADQIESVGDGTPTLVQQACLTTHMLLQSDDERTLGVAAKVVVDMERINQADEAADEKTDAAQEQHVHFHQHGTDRGAMNDIGVVTAQRIQRARMELDAMRSAGQLADGVRSGEGTNEATSPAEAVSVIG